MAFFTIVLALILSITFIHGLNLVSNRIKKLPPGPTPLPIIGNLHLLGNQPHKFLAKLAKTYGPIMCLRLGQINTVVISSSAMAKEVLQKQDNAFSSCRNVQDVLRAHDHYQHSVVLLPVSSKWRNIRKILKSNIFSTDSLDFNKDIRIQKVQDLIVYCRKISERGEAVDIGRAAFTTGLNLLSNTVFSEDLIDPFSDSIQEFKRMVKGMTTLAGTPNLADFFPCLTKFDPQGYRLRMNFYEGEVLQLFRSLINERLEEQSLNHKAKNDVIEVLLATIKQKPEEINGQIVEHLCLDLFVAGTDTTSSTVEWAMAEAMKNPSKTKRAKLELDDVIGKGKLIDEADLSRLPYLRCFVKETMRLHPPAPLLLPRRLQEDVDLCGYTVPKNSQVFVNAWAIGRDPETWDDPLEFKPEQFLDSEMWM